MEDIEEWTTQAKWIWLPSYNDNASEARFFRFRKSFTLNHLPKSCLIHVSADTRYRLYVNGESVAFGPCKSYPTRWYFETVDIAPLLFKGENTLCANVLRFSSHHAGNTSMMRTAYPGFLLHSEGSEVMIDSDESWKVIEDKSIVITPRSEWNYYLGPPFLSLSETVDGEIVDENWKDSKYDDSHWISAIVVNEKLKMMPMLSSKRLIRRSIPALPEIPMEFDNALKCSGSVSLESWRDFLHKGHAIHLIGGEAVTVDIESSRLTTGFLHMEFTSAGTASITILCSEAYERAASPGKPRFKGNRADFQNGELYGPVDQCIAKAGFNSYQPFWWRTFRYVRLTITPTEPLTLSKFNYRETFYPLDIQSQVDISPELNKMWSISLNTLKNCMHETYEDCPYYEQNQFVMDSRIQMLFTYQISRDDRLARKCIHEFYASRREDGLIETHFPVPFRCVNIPQFSLYWILMLHDHMLYFQDKPLIKRYLGTADDILQHFERRLNDQGLVGRFDLESWPFIDWVKEWHGTGGLQAMGMPISYRRTGVATYNSLLYAMVLNHAADLCEYVSRPDTAKDYRRRAQSINDAVNKHCFDKGLGLYMDGPDATEFTQHSQVFAVLSGAITGEEASELMRRTLEEPMPKCSYSMSFYVLRAAAKAGIYEEKFDQLMQPWRKMMRDNLTTWAEDDVMFRSDCHGWSSSPIYEIVAEIIRLRPTATGLSLKPRMGLLKTGKGTFITAKGELFISWQDGGNLKLRSSGDIEFELILPHETKRISLVSNEDQIIE